MDAIPTDPRFGLNGRNQAFRRERRIMAFALLLALMGIAGLIALIVWQGQSGTRHTGGVASVPLQAEAAPVPPDLASPGFMPLSEDSAKAMNAEIPLSNKPLEAAVPFRMAFDSSAIINRITALDCLTAAIYYEAANEPGQGQRAVAQVVLNRMRHPAYPHSVCGVVYQGSERSTGCQFSFTCDGSLSRTPSSTGWTRARSVASAALSGYVEPSVGTATHYHANYVVPYWASAMDKIAVIGAHIFYRWRGAWGTRRAFQSAYVGETQVGKGVPTDMPGLTGPTIVPEMDASISEPSLEDRPLADQAGIVAEPRGRLSSKPNADLEIDRPQRRLKADEERGVLKEGGLNEPYGDTRGMPAGGPVPTDSVP